MAENWTENQLKALNDRGSLLVSASAGSGKTTIMIERILQFLENGGAIRRLVVITFSRASAREMKEKLLKEMYTQIRQGAPAAQWLKAQVKDAPFANICTIDSFCADIFHRYFEDIGKDPSAEILDEGESKELLNEVIDELFNKYLASGDAAFMSLAEQYSENRKLDGLKGMIVNICKYINALASPMDFLQKAKEFTATDIESAESSKFLLGYYKQKAQKLRAACDSLLTKIAYLEKSGLPLNAVYFDILSSTLSGLTVFIDSCVSVEKFLACASVFSSEKIPADRKLFLDMRDEVRESAKGLIKEVRRFFDGIKKEFSLSTCDYNVFCLREKLAKRNNGTLIDLAIATVNGFNEAKSVSKKVDFSDVEHYALQILSNKTRADEVKDAIDYIFMDEYQDTNYLQEAIVSAIAKDNLFMVGDVKQSIYKFRFAEPQLFLDRRKNYSDNENGTNVDLNDNFRSESGVLLFINLVCDQVMTPDFGKVDYKNEARLVAGKEYKVDPSIPPATIKFFPKEKTTTEYETEYKLERAPKLAVKESQEATYIANKIEELVGRKKIFDKQLNDFRLIEYRDIAVLVRKKRSATPIFSALSALNIPYVAVGFNGDNLMDDINLLISLVRVADNSRQDIPLVAVCRSYFGGFSENELMSIRMAAPDKKFFWEAFYGYGKEDTLKYKIDIFINNIAKLKVMSQAMTVDKLYDTILAETGYDAYLISTGNLSRIVTVNTFISKLRGREYARSVAQFLSLVDSGQQIDVELPPADDNAVLFQTIHSSKGMEYPIVFYAKADDGFNVSQNARNVLLMDNKFGITLKHRDEASKLQSDTISAIAYAKKAKIDELEEGCRLMYVAMTRARYHLFVTGAEVSKTKMAATAPEDCASPAEWIYYASTMDNRLEQYFDREEVEKTPIIAPIIGKLFKDGAKPHLSKEYPHQSSTNISTKYAVSAIAKQDDQDTNVSYIPRLGDTNADLGTLYHAILENIDITLTAKSDIMRAVAQMADDGVIDFMENTVDYDILERILTSDLFNLARKSAIKRELPFMLYVPAKEIMATDSDDKVLVQGVIDLVIFGEQNILVDYKMSNMSAETLKKRYKSQIDIYAMAVERVMKIKLDRRVLYIINQNLQIDIK